jgi:AcrR family transcriptional regulator
MNAAAPKRERAQQVRRQAILQAADQMLLGRDLASTAMEERVPEAGGSKRAFDLGFNDELFLTLALDALVEADAPDASPRSTPTPSSPSKACKDS